MKKSIVLGVCLFLLACGWAAKEGTVRGRETSSETEVVSGGGRHVVPQDADMGAYLAGIISRENRDMTRASVYYAEALKKDPTNQSLQTDAYLIAGLSGQTDAFIEAAGPVANQQNPLFADMVLAAESLKKGNYADVLKITDESPRHEMNALLFPILRAWGYAGLKDEKKAVGALSPLKSDKDIAPVYWYHKALIHDYFGQRDEANKAYQELAKSELPSVTALLAIRSFYVKNGNWTDQNPLFKKYYETIQNTPALSEVLIERADEFNLNAPTKGAAEAFYMVSAISGAQAKAPETGLLFNSLALYMNPDLTLYKIWGAEQFEGVEYYAEANRLYDKIQNPSDTILFKKALNMMLMKQNKAAEKVLLSIVSRQPNDPLLLVMIGDLYRDTNRSKMAITYYTRALNILDKTQDKVMTGKTYMARAMAHENLKDRTAAEKDLKKALDLSPNNATVLNYLGYSWLEQNKNIDQAMGYVQAAAKLEPSSPHIWDSLAWGYYRQGNYVKAVEYAERAADKIPYSAVVQAHLGDIYAAAGRGREAGYQYKKALELKADMTPELRTELKKKTK